MLSCHKSGVLAILLYNSISFNVISIRNSNTEASDKEMEFTLFSFDFVPFMIQLFILQVLEVSSFVEFLHNCFKFG